MIERRMLRERRFPPSLIPILAALKVTPRPGSYCVVTLPAETPLERIPEGGRRLSVGWGDGSQSLILPEEQWNELARGIEGAAVEKGFRVLSLTDVPGESEGSFISVVASMLFDAQVNARPAWSPGRFDLIVKSRDLKTTREALSLIVNRAKGRLRTG